MAHRSQICPILFADVVKSSSITADAHKRSLAEFLDQVFSDACGRIDVVHAKPMGDGFLIVGSNAAEIASVALRIRNAYQTHDWKNEGFPKAVEIRVGLDLGTVLFEGEDVTGAAVDRASRVQPVTHPNSVFCTKHFHDQLIADMVTKIVGTSVGTIALDKGAGNAEMFELGWSDEPPVGTMSGQAAEAPKPSHIPRVKRTISDRERDRFLEECFTTIRAHFQRSLDELDRADPHVETTFQEVHSTKFFCRVYVDGDERAACKVRCKSGSGEIQYEENPRDVDNDTTSNEILWIKDDGVDIFAEVLGMQAHYTGGKMDVRLNPQQAAEHIWRIFSGALER